MTVTNLPDVPQPAEAPGNGTRRWSWYDRDRDQFLIDAGTDPAHAVLVASEICGTWLTAGQCREAAAVLLAMADESEAGAR